jgi:hypothetical protein
MLNWIIRLQVVGEIITNQTAYALELLTRQQIHASIYQNHLALHYFLAEEGMYVSNSTIQTVAIKFVVMDKQ